MRLKGYGGIYDLYDPYLVPKEVIFEIYHEGIYFMIFKSFII